MDKGDLYIYGPMFAMLGWMYGYQIVFPALSGETVMTVAMGLLIGPIFLLELYVSQVTSSCSYVRAVVRPHGDVMRFYIKDYEDIRGEIYNTRRIETNWAVKTHYHGRVSEIKILYEGKWNDRVLWSRGKARLWEYEVDHRAVENLILYEVMEGTLDYDHTKEIPCYYLENASGDYFDKIGLIEYTKEEEEKPAEDPPEEEEKPIEEEVSEEEIIVE